jgi:hypothetical protein
VAIFVAAVMSAPYHDWLKGGLGLLPEIIKAFTRNLIARHEAMIFFKSATNNPSLVESSCVWGFYYSEPT